MTTMHHRPRAKRACMIQNEIISVIVNYIVANYAYFHPCPITHRHNGDRVVKIPPLAYTRFIFKVLEIIPGSSTKFILEPFIA